MTFGKIGFTSILLFFIVCPLFALSAETGNPDVAPDISAKMPSPGNYHALIIGIDSYTDWEMLRTCVRDAESLKQILVQRYGFNEKNVVLRTNDEATRLRISNDLRNLASSLGKQDNLLIYFSGHGQLDDLTGDGYWIPVEGDPKDPGTWISHSTVKNLLGSEKVNCKNIIVVADSCFAGGLFRESSSPVSLKDADYREKLLKFSDRRSRQVITTGGFKPVVDGPRGGHSLFGDLFLKALEENTADVVDLENLCYKILWDNVDKISGQKPRIGRFNTPMDDGGLFVLFNRNNFIENEKKRMAEERDRKEQDQLTALLEARQKLEAERLRLEEERKALEEKKTIEAERAKIEKETAEKQRLAEELNKKEQVQSAALRTERENLEAERRQLESEKKALEQSAALKTERGKLEAERRQLEAEKKALEQLTALQAEREKLEAERVRLEAEKEKIVAPISGGLTRAGVALRHKRIAINTTQQIHDLVEGHNFFDSHFNPDGDFENHFVDNGNETVTDLATGLMWQKGGSSKAFGDGTRVKNFMEDLNENRFGGFADWRLPTLEELASLLESKRATGKSFSDPVFSELPSSISSDFADGGKTSSMIPWVVDFENGHITIGPYYRIDWLPLALRGAGIPHHKQFANVKAVRTVGRNDRIQKHPQQGEKPTAFIPGEPGKPATEEQKPELTPSSSEQKEKQAVATIPKVTLRSEKQHNPSFEEPREKYNFFHPKWNKEGDFQNDLVDNGDGTVTDRATGLMWQKGGSDRELSLYPYVGEPASGYVKELNTRRFSGFSDWRLPTIEELASLLEPRKINGDLHIAPLFSDISTCTSADTYDTKMETRYCYVDFAKGKVVRKGDYVSGALKSYVRAVRSVK